MEILLQAALMALGIVALMASVVYAITRLPDLPDGEWRRQLEPYLTVRNAALGAGVAVSLS